ncbi:MAG: PhnD/SsuA/transferrin family substrate-binding protein [Magnetococcales bacterium]|nr:PhnD/SsuA/transferrin family substrate-binding protein [Magnetococcales bacterium]
MNNFRVYLYFLLFFMLPCGPARGEEPLTLGVLAYRPQAQTEQQWQPLADYLTQSLSGRTVRLIVADYAGLEALMERFELDFVLTNPIHYIRLLTRNTLSGALATMIQREGDQVIHGLAGTIIARSGRADLRTLSDLSNKTLAAVSIDSLGGYYAQLMEFKRAGITMPRGNRLLLTDPPHDRVVTAVLEGRVDAGFVRAGVLEEMIREGKLIPGVLKVINSQKMASHPFLTSTRLYPHWPFVALSRVEPKVARQVATALLSLDAESPAAQAAFIGGFGIPADYTLVEEMARALRLPPFDRFSSITLSELWLQYRWYGMVGMLILMALMVLSYQLFQTNRRLQESEARYHALFDHAADAIFLADPESGIIQDANAAASRLMGMAREQIRGLHHTRLHPPSIAGKVRANFLQHIHDKVVDSARPIVTEVQRADGQSLPVEVTGGLIPFSGKSVLQGNFRDISWRRRMETDLIQAKEYAEAASRAKSDFLAAMSHEIRTPMNVVLGMAEMLLESELNTHQRHFARTMHNSGKALLGVINDVLDFSRIESGRFTLVEEPYSPRQVVRETVRLMRIAAEEKGLTMSESIDPDIPDAMLGDHSRVRQVLINLLGNAIKFTAHGSVELRLSRAPQEADTVLLSVIDTGIGIAPEQIDIIFEQFTQADAGITRRYGGTGLGLAISRRLVQMMGGRLWAESRSGVGSAFRFTLPVRWGELPSLRLEPEQDTPIDHGRSLRILLAEDAEENRILFEAYLLDSSHRLVMVNDGVEAVSRVRHDAEGFDVVVMDIQMPNMDGYTAIRHIRVWEQENGRAPLPIITLSAHVLDGEVERTREAGGSLYLSKPIGKKKLLATLQQVVPLESASESATG